MKTSTSEYILHHLREAGSVELRHKDSSGSWHTGWFNQVEAFLAEARWLSVKGDLYTSIQAPRPRIVNNKMDSGSPVRNDDIGYYIRLPFDLDPVRATGSNSTAEELQAAHDAALNLRQYLGMHGWPLPALACSGNGFHLLYRTRLPANEETRHQLKLIYRGLSNHINSELVTFDQKVRNPGRILRLYGSVNRKGEHTAERPWRTSWIELPASWRQVTPQQIANLASQFEIPIESSTPSGSSRSKVDGSGDYQTLDVVSWFQSKGNYIGHIESNIHAVQCPWQHEHTSDSPENGSDSIIYEADQGWPGFYCHHGHCESRDIRDVLSLWSDADQFCSNTWEVSR